jgi:Txe/YoeB family toxin of Txe-Axe toxin-antitoxin module
MRDIRVGFPDIKVKEAFEALKGGKSSDKEVYEAINKAIDALKENPKCGISVPKDLIPAVYTKKYDVDNLWKYNLPRSWRLIYTLKADEIAILAIILEWMDHKNYNRRFGYS